MQIQLRLFAALAEAAGSRALSLEVPAHATAGEVRDQLVVEYPQLVLLCTRVAFAVNAQYANADQLLSEGDELALIPPVSGG